MRCCGRLDSAEITVELQDIDCITSWALKERHVTLLCTSHITNAREESHRVRASRSGSKTHIIVTSCVNWRIYHDAE
jgi:hypothetical protein